jgi:hypothetical protein
LGDEVISATVARPLRRSADHMGKPTVYADTLARAAVAIGSEKRLAKALRVPLADLRDWLHGTAYPSTQIYQDALDLLIAIGSH